MRKVSLVLVSMFIAAGGCRGGGDDDGGGGGGGGGADGGGGGGAEVTIQQIQSDDMPVGTPVTVRGVVVTAIDSYGSRIGGIYVEEPDGGPFSGVYVFLKGTEAAGLKPGDLVDIEGGVKDEFAYSTDDSGRALTEISPPEGGDTTVTQVGTGTMPAPEVVTPWDLASSDDEAEKWEGVLIEFDNVRVNSAPRSVSKSDDTLLSMDVTGPFPVESSLTELADTIAKGDCYSKIVGVEDYFLNYQLLPRAADDLGAGADGDCLAPESGDELCADSMDNDHNGFTDCEDNACVDATVACPATGTTVADIQNGTVDPDTRVNLTGVHVTAVSANTHTFWAADAAAAAQYAGIAVYDSNFDLSTVAVGDTLDLAGTTKEFSCLSDACADNTMTELVNFTASNITPGGATPTPVTVPVATLAAEASEEPYEGVLVKVENVAVVNPDLGHGDFSIGTAGSPVIVDDDMFKFTPTAGQCLGSVTGVLSRNIFDGNITLLPRSAADVDDAPGTCN